MRCPLVSPGQNDEKIGPKCIENVPQAGVRVQLGRNESAAPGKKLKLPSCPGVLALEQDGESALRHAHSSPSGEKGEKVATTCRLAPRLAMGANQGANPAELQPRRSEGATLVFFRRRSSYTVHTRHTSLRTAGYRKHAVKKRRRVLHGAHATTSQRTAG